MTSVESTKGIQKDEPNEVIESENGEKELLSNKTIRQDGKSNHIANTLLPNQPSMRTRHKPRNKSILQSAIARKEKSLRVDDQPKQRQRRVKPKPSDESLSESLDDSVSSHTTTPLKRVKRTSSKVTVKKKIFVGSESSDEAVNNILDTNASDNKTATRCREQLALRLCKCTEDKQLYMKSDKDSQFCTAIDGITDKLIGCTKLVDVTTVPMFRPSARVPFGVFCESHRKRLTRHNCCPTCGVFCTQGNFAECPSKHHFHKDCRLSVGQTECCPHCGDFSPSTDIVISMQSSKPPVYLPDQVPHQ